MTTLVKFSAYGDTDLEFDTEPSSWNPVVTCGLQGGEPAFVVTPTGANFFGKSPLGSPATVSLRFSITPSAFPTASNPIFAPLTSVGASAWRIRMSSTGTLIFDNNANTASVTSPAMTAGNTYTFKVRVSATTIQVRMLNGIRGGAQVGSDLSGTSTFGLMDSLRMGQASGTPIVPPYRLQHILVTDTDEWLPDAPAPSAVAGKVFAVIGDSNTAQMGANGEYFRQALLNIGISPRNVYFWGVGGKRTSIPDTSGSSNNNANAKTAMQNVQDALALYGTVDHFMIALGTNDRPYVNADVNGYIDSLLAAIGTGPKVTWIGLTSKGSASADDIRINGLIQAKLAARGNAVFADWDAHIRAIDGGANPSPYWLTTDTTHNSSPEGYEVSSAFRANLLVEAATQPWDAVYVGSELATAMYVGAIQVWP